MSVGPSVALRQADTLSSSWCAGTEVILSTFVTPFPTISLPELLWSGRRRAVDRALSRQLNECVLRAELPGRLPVFWVSGCQWCCVLGMGFSRINAFCTPLNLLKRPESLEVGDGALSKLLACKVNDHLCVSPTSSARHGCTCTVQKIACLFAHVALSYLDGFMQRMLLSKKIIKNASLMKGLSNMYTDLFGSQQPGVL